MQFNNLIPSINRGNTTRSKRMNLIGACDQCLARDQLPMKLNTCNNTQPFTNQPTIDGSQSGLESTLSLTISNSPPISRDSEEAENGE